jgi:hypothetical protein
MPDVQAEKGQSMKKPNPNVPIASSPAPTSQIEAKYPWC